MQRRHMQSTEAERLLDQAIELTFPASDPIAVESAYHRIASPASDIGKAINPEADRNPRQD